jgi:copper chaperone NosL
MKELKSISRVIVALSALLMVSAYFVPLWQILMWAPQYPEGLEMKIWIDNLSGSVKIISALNHYIGMRPIEVSMFPEFGYMKYIVGVLIGFGLLTAWLNKRGLLFAYLVLIIAWGLAALIDFYMWGYDYGHNLDPTAPIIVPGMSYQPPLIGTKQLLNFTAFSGPDVGGWIFMVAAAMAVGAVVFERWKNAKSSMLDVTYRSKDAKPIYVFLCATFFTSCSVKPEPLIYGTNSCHSCKMILMDKKFGAEVVTKKGKVYTFDDANCMINFVNSEQLAGEEAAFKLIVDYSQPEKLIPVEHAFFLKSDTIRSPMNSGIAAFEKEEAMEEFKKKWKAIYLGWGEVQTEFK